MDELTLKTFVLGQLSNNCYLIFSEKSKEGFLIDNPAPYDEVEAFVQKNNIDIQFIALTHAHFDHITGLESNSIPFYVHREDAPFLKDSRLNGSTFFSPGIGVGREPRLYEENKPLYFEKYAIEILHTPGHTPGSVSLKLNNWVFSGDALFFNSIGRTDIPLASEEVLVDSIKRKILTLKPDILVYPGHGPSTTVGREIKSNPFLRV